MKGEGIRADFTVTESDEAVQVSADDQELVDAGAAELRGVRAGPVRPAAGQDPAFVDAYETGDDDAARTIYADARTHWERIETVAESFGDLDPKMDAREADLEPGQKWTGWHLIEKDLWPARAEDYTPLTDKERATYADDLLANTKTLDKRIQTTGVHRRPDRQRLPRPARGGRHRQGDRRGGVLVAHRPLGLPGQRRRRARRLRGRQADPRAEGPRPRRSSSTQRFAELQTLLDAQRDGDGFTLYDDLTPDEIKALVRRRQRALRAAVEADGGGARLIMSMA